MSRFTDDASKSYHTIVNVCILIVKDPESPDKRTDDEKRLVTPITSKYNENFVFEKSFPVTSDHRKDSRTVQVVALLYFPT